MIPEKTKKLFGFPEFLSNRRIIVKLEGKGREPRQFLLRGGRSAFDVRVVESYAERLRRDGAAAAMEGSVAAPHPEASKFLTPGRS